MKLKNLFLGSFALTAMLLAQSCDDKNDGPTGAPSIELSTQTLDFEKDGGSQTIKLTATRDWNVTNVPDWIAVDPKSGNPAENKEVTITVLENTGMDRSQDIKFTIGFDAKTLTVNQKGTGSASEMIVYHNDFDKEKATQTDKKWPFLDSFEGWKNAKGSGVGSETYAYNAVTVRANSTSGSSYSDYSGSDANNLFFGSNAYFSVQGIKLSSEVNYTLSFGAENTIRIMVVFSNMMSSMYISATMPRNGLNLNMHSLMGIRKEDGILRNLTSLFQKEHPLSVSISRRILRAHIVLMTSTLA